MTFQDLPEVSGYPSHRLVNGQPMDEEQFRIEGWTVTAEYEVNGRKVPCWAADLDGLRRYAELKRARRDSRKSEWRYRQEADEAWSEHVTSLIEEAR